MLFLKKTLSILLISATLSGLCYANDSKLSRSERNEKLGEIKAQLAYAFFQNGDIRNALDAIEESVRLNSRSATAWLIRAQIYQYMQEPNQVEQSFQRAFSSKELIGETNNNYGWYLCQNNQEAKSISYFDRAIADRTYPQPHTALMNKGICLGKLGQYNEGTQALKDAIRMSPPGFYYPMKELAQIYYKTKNGPLAEQYFSQYVSKSQRLEPDALLLVIRIGQLIRNNEWVYNYSQELKNRYPTSPELQELLSGAM